MYLWHNHQRTLWFERLHSEKPTNIYNLMSQNISGLELPRLYDPAWVHVNRTDVKFVRMHSAPAWVPTLFLIVEGNFLFGPNVLVPCQQGPSLEKMTQMERPNPRRTGWWLSAAQVWWHKRHNGERKSMVETKSGLWYRTMRG